MCSTSAQESLPLFHRMKLKLSPDLMRLLLLQPKVPSTTNNKIFFWLVAAFYLESLIKSSAFTMSSRGRQNPLLSPTHQLQRSSRHSAMIHKLDVSTILSTYSILSHYSCFVATFIFSWSYCSLASIAARISDMAPPIHSRANYLLSTLIIV